jgi:TonB family protein
LSDKDRRAQTVQRAERPDNPLPFARGNSPERMEAPPTNLPPKPSVPEPPPSGAENSAPPLLSESPAAPERPPDVARPSDARGPAVGVIADAIRNVRRYTQATENFGNPRGGQDQNVGSTIQFDSKGVEFGPWLARFIAQVRSNWMIPQAAMSMHGNVSISFVVHRDGRITEVVVSRPSAINAFTLSGRNAILTSNPTIPLPLEYPDDRMPITVTFFFNEQPPR